MKKDKINADVVTRKLKSASIRATNNRLEAAREERQKREEMIKREKAETMAAKRRRARERISLFIKKEDENDSIGNMDPN